MKAHYKGYEIDCRRERSLGGDSNLYFTVVRESDGLIVVDDFTTGKDRVRDFVQYMKDRVDEFIATKGESEFLEDEY